nr:uncharacterized protein I203_07733 [Kwoniella mangroviensis CBS 8507]OCF63308.1 hypothetical protein I203_07733 [Kwoniella mangroviensis CBS 8507]
MYTSLAHTILPLSLLGTTLAGVIRIRGEDDHNYDPKNHQDDHDKDDHHNHYSETSPQFIGCVSRIFFNLVSSDDNFDGDFTEQSDLNPCIDHCVDEKFRYTYWDADRKQCYCSPAQRPDADQIRDNDSETGRCKNRDAIVFLNNADFIFGGCFDSDSSDYGVAPVARFSTTSVRDCFVLCDEPCRDKFVEVVAITPRFDPALYSFAYDCECFDISYDDLPPLVNRTCAIDSIFGYARDEHKDDDHHKKEGKRGDYDYDYDYDSESDHGYKGGHRDEDYDRDDDRDKDHDYKHHDDEDHDHHEKDDKYDPDYHKNHKGDYNNDDSDHYLYGYKGKHHKGDYNEEEESDPDYDHGKDYDHEEDDEEANYDYDHGKEQDDNQDDGDENHSKDYDGAEEDEDPNYHSGKGHGNDGDDTEHHKGDNYNDEDFDDNHHDDHDYDHKKKHNDDHDYNYGSYGKADSTLTTA